MIEYHIIVCGGRHFENYALLCKTLAENFGNDIEEIVSGHCQGADTLGEKWAKEHDVPCKIFPAEWKRYGKKAGPMRNKQMVDYIDGFSKKAVVAFTSLNSVGTRNTIALAKRKGISVIETPYIPLSDTQKIVLEEVVNRLKTDTIPYGAVYILPDGRLLDLSILENGHADLWAYLDEEIPKTSCPQYDSANFLRDLGWIKANTKEEYISSDYTPTPKQMSSIEKILKIYPIKMRINLQ